LEKREEGCSTPKKKLTFNLPGGSDGKSQGKWANANPFETLNEEARTLGFFKKTPEALEEGWTFQHSYDILGARMLWKPKEARILKNF
jgi:hypothetical protein